MDCGLRCEYPEVFEFDHRPGETKVADVTKLRVGKMSALVAEIAKCDVVCANCHRIRTVTRRDAARGYGQDRPRQIPASTPPDQMTLNWSA